MTSKTPKNAKIYICEPCNFKCSKMSDYNRHILTAKHKMMTNDDKNDDNFAQKNAKAFVCEDCGNQYKYRQGLSVHRKKCQKTPTPNNINSGCKKSLIVEPIAIKKGL